MMRMNFQDALKETLEQIKVHLKDKQIEAISSLLTDVIDASFYGQCYSISVPSVWGQLRSKQLLELHQTFFPHPIHGKKAVWPRETNRQLDLEYNNNEKRPPTRMNFCG